MKKEMKIYKFMSAYELRRILEGETLKKYTEWSCLALSDAKGFCFFPETIHLSASCLDDSCYEDDYERQEWEVGIDGIYENNLKNWIDADILVEFENNGLEFEDACGVYPDPWYTAVQADELCTCMYNRNVLKPIRFAFIFHEKFKWHDISMAEKAFKKMSVHKTKVSVSYIKPEWFLYIDRQNFSFLIPEDLRYTLFYMEIKGCSTQAKEWIQMNQEWLSKISKDRNIHVEIYNAILDEIEYQAINN